jgi:hypothetical protein
MRDDLVPTYHSRFQARRVHERDEGGIYIIQAGLAFRLEFVKEIEQPESEHCAGLFPRCREPPCVYKLSVTGSGGTGLAAEAVGDANGVNAGDVEEGERSRDRG